MSMYVWFAFMLVISQAWLIWFLYRPLKTKYFNIENSNTELCKQKQIELEQDFQQNLIDKSMLSQAKSEIIQTLAIEIKQTTNHTNSVKENQTVAMWLVAVIVVFLLITSLGVYQFLTSDYKTPIVQMEKALALEQGVVKIKQHLEEKPNDSQAWHMLGLTLFELNKINQSLEAYERSYQISQKNVPMLIGYATALSVAQNNFSGRIPFLVREALEIDENSTDALYLAGWIAISEQQQGLAQKLWKKMLSLLPEGQANKAVIQQMLDELEQMKTDKSSISMKNTSLVKKDKAAPRYYVKVNVELSKRLQQTKFQDYYLMIYVKAAQGRPMPISIQKIKLKNFSGSVVLTDENSPMPSKKLSQSSKVIAVVRLSKSGLAMRQIDDIEAISQVINVKDNPDILLKLK